MTSIGKKVKESYVEQVKKQWKKKPLEDSIVLAIHIYFGTKRRCDIDNFNKLVWDSLTGLVWKDDSQIDELVISRYFDKENPRIELFINP
jgi:Holliday junction resolvase RusA-like endonuclease